MACVRTLGKSACRKFYSFFYNLVNFCDLPVKFDDLFVYLHTSHYVQNNYIFKNHNHVDKRKANAMPFH